ncbi:MAG: Methyltransferase type 11 [Aeromicrobium sp.]|nr:Methyltransferase type 11 [Aeromicrobium sp.]
MTDSDDRSWPRAADRLGRDAAAGGDPTRWVEELWSSAERDEIETPWDRSDPFPDVARRITELGPGVGGRAVVVGAALGADAEAIARAGWDTVAFDVSPAAVRLARQRYPDSDVDYRIGDLLDLPEDLVGAFDLVVEVFTVQSMPPTVRDRAIEGIRGLIAADGSAIVVQYVRGDAGADDGPPWMLDRTEMEMFGGDGIDIDLEVRPSPRADQQIWVATLRRT